MLFIHELDRSKWAAMNLSELIPARMLLRHEINQSWITELLDLHFLSLVGLVMLQALAKCLIQVANLVPFSVNIFDRCPVESPHELHPSNGALSCFRTAHLFCEDRVVHDSQVANLRELVELVERLPVVNQVVLHREHVKVSPAWLVVDRSDSVLVQSQALEIRQDSEL